MTSSGRIPVAVLGGTGMVGQRLIAMLADHPWFEVTAITATDRRAGQPYGDSVQWALPTPIPFAASRLPIQPTTPPLDCRIVFSALSADVAGAIEWEFARWGNLVVSNASSHRMDPAVPLLIPEVNPDHLSLIRKQAFDGGAIITNPNCSTIGLALALKPLHDEFVVKSVHVTTLQAISGAGLPGVPAVELLGNVIPFIADEESKLEMETLKILGVMKEEGVSPLEARVSAQCNRVPVVDGHTLCVSVELELPTTVESLRQAWEGFRGEPQFEALPTAPGRPVHYLGGAKDPQPRLHRDLEGGMAVSVGRARVCSILDYKFVALSHNTVRGAAGGALLCAELAVRKGVMEGLASPVTADAE